jgi:hypothetical protein
MVASKVANFPDGTAEVEDIVDGLSSGSVS